MGYLYYLIYFLPVFLFSLFAQVLVKTSYKKFSKINNSRNITGAAAAAAVLNYYGIKNVRIAPCRGSLTDNYNPKDNTVYLSEGVYNSTTIAAIGIACHEVGHAIQHAENYLPVKIRSSLVGVTNFGSRFGLLIAFAGYFIYLASYLSIGRYAIIFGLLLYGLTAVFSLITLPVEFNATKRAFIAIDSLNLLYGDEVSSVKKVLYSAALTYVAALATSLANLLYYATRLLGSNRRNR